MEWEPFGLYDWLEAHDEGTKSRYVLANSGVLPCTFADLGAPPDLFEGMGLGQANALPFAPELRDLIARTYDHPPSQTLVTLAGSEADLLAYFATVKAGDKVVVENPTYPPLAAMPKAFGCRVVRHARTWKNRFRLDLGKLEEQLKGARLLVVSNLNNPTGAGITAKELEELAAIAARRKCLVLVDEAFRELAFDRPPLAANVSDRFLSTNTLTKCYGLGGLRTGWLLAPKEVAERALRAKKHISTGHPVLEQKLAFLALHERQELLARARRIRDKNFQTLGSWVEDSAPVAWAEPAGGGPVALRLPDGLDDRAFAERLAAEHETLVGPGSVQGLPGFVRVGLGSEPAHMAPGLKAIEAALAPLPARGRGRRAGRRPPKP